MKQNVDSNGNVFELKARKNKPGKGGLENPLRAELIEVLLDWVNDTGGPASEHVRDLMDRLGIGQSHPPVVVEHLATSVMPVVNQRLWSENSEVRLAPMHHSNGLQLLRLSID